MEHRPLDESIIPSRLPLHKIVLPHHKEEREWGPYPLEVELPYDLALALHLYLKYSYPVVNAAKAHSFLFMRSNGHPLENEHLCMWWKAMQVSRSAPWEPFAPNSFRDIHVLDRVMHFSTALASTPSVGRDLVGDAAIMQNSLGRLWEVDYNKGGAYFNAMVKTAVDKMTLWRHVQYERLKEAEEVHAADEW